MQRALNRRLFYLFLAILALPPATGHGQTTLSSDERRIADRVSARAAEQQRFLEQIINTNSFTGNQAGVRIVGEMFRARLDSLGFETRWVPFTSSGFTSAHLVAERRGQRGRRVLLIGHLDTVYPPDDPFQQYVERDTIAFGPGVIDAKGGDAVLLYALIALHDAGMLDDVTIAVALAGDEEDATRPYDVSRAELVELARRSDVALAFEPAARDMAHASPSRLGFASWQMTAPFGDKVPGTEAELENSAAFRGAVEIIKSFNEAFRRSEYTSVYALGARVDSASGLVVEGGMRFTTSEEWQRAGARMKELMQERHRSGGPFALMFGEPYPGMAPRAENDRLLRTLNDISLALGAGTVSAGDPRQRGGGDISFVAHLIPGLDGLGPAGADAHSRSERVNLPSLTLATQRAALLLYRLTR